MARFVKDALRPGSYSVPDATGTGRRTLTYTADDVEHLARRFAEMKANGFSVPVCWEHQPDAWPDKAEALAQRAKQTIGFLDDARVEDGTLVFEFDVEDEEDARRLGKVRFASPGIMPDWTDGEGRTWPGRSVIHLAATARPVQHRQGRFERMGFAEGLEFLSLADYLGDTTMADDKDSDDKPFKKKDGGEGEGEGKDMKKVLEALATLGVPLPDDTDWDNLCDRLIGAAATKGGSDLDTEIDDKANKMDDTPTPAPGANSPVMMSMQREINVFRKRAIDLERKDLAARVHRLRDTGRVNKPLADKLLGALKTEQLSLDADGHLAVSALVAKVQAYEELDAGASTPVHLSHERPSVPPNPDDEADEKEQNEVAVRLSRGRFQPPVKTNGDGK